MAAKTDDNEYKVLEKRVQTLENKLWVAYTVGAIFGISGAFGFSMLHTAQKELVELKDGVQVVENAKDGALSDIWNARNSAVADMRTQSGLIVKEAVSDQIPGITEKIDDIGKLNYWTAYVYIAAAQSAAPGDKDGSGVWQKALKDDERQAVGDLHQNFQTIQRAIERQAAKQ
jgi:hypothetical protein